MGISIDLKRLSVLVWLAGAFSPATAEEGLPATYFQIPECTGLSGVAVYYFTNLPELARMDISDVCLLPSGDLAAIEPLHNLSVVGQQDWGQQLENLDVGENSIDRRRVRVRDFDQSAPQGYAQSSGNLEISHGPDLPQSWGATEYWAKGYVFDTAYQNEGATDAFSVFAELFVHDSSGLQHGISAAIFLGEIQFEGGTATSLLGDYGGMTLNPAVDVNLVLSKDGSITGGGNIYFENAGLAGFGPTEFKTVRLSIEKLVGHVAGNEGRELRILGVATGTYEAHNGNSYPLNASVEFMSQ